MIDCYRFIITLLQNFRGFAATNIEMNKNGESSESKINLYLNQNNLKKRTMQIRNKLFDPSEVLEKKEKTSGFQKIQKFV